MLVNVRACDFRVRAGGPADGTPVLLLHGFPQHGGMWDAVVPALHDAGLRTYAPDQRGYSPFESPVDGPALDDWRMPNLVADMLALLDELGVDQAHVVGHDWGSVVGWHLAGSHVDRVRTFTALSVPHPDAMGRARRAQGSDQKDRSSYLTLFAQEGKAEELLLADDAARLWRIFEPLSREQAASYVEPLLAPGALTGALNWYRRLERPDLGPAQAPVTFIWGQDDAAVGPVAAHSCPDYVAPGVDYRFVPLPDTSHWIVDQQPALVATEILARAGSEGRAPSFTSS
jgi:pimeloyl-ACP methyl ester carboxylesterase